MNSPNLAECNYATMRGCHFEVAVLPFGATEPHNLHLPYGNDTLTVTAIAESACRKANEQGASALLLPSMPYGVDSNLMAFPFTMNCRPSTHLTFMQDLVDSLEHHGICKLVIANGHGGNEFGFILREMFGATSVFLSVYEWWKAVEDNLPPDCRPTGDHADHMETSLSLYLFPHLVDMRVADDGATKTCRLEAVRKGYVKITRPWHLVTRNAGVGDPRQATAEKGEKIFNLAVEQLAAYLVELSAAEMDETFPY
ncbi:MAG TPA: creatininase family protein [bacterium]|nr:creatininase family protein [bacterium]HQL62933.1 creatininase family protein [bacterium]